LNSLEMRWLSRL